MNDYGKLASTGIPALTVAGVALSQYTLIGLAVALTLAGALIVRVSFRRGRSLTDQ